MRDLVQYLQAHALLVAPDAGANVVFFGVTGSATASAFALRAAIAQHALQFDSVDVFDGEEHGYIELGAWLGSQELALRLIGLGAQLGLWQLLTPYSVLGPDTEPDLARKIAGAGMVTLLAPKVPAAVD